MAKVGARLGGVRHGDGALPEQAHEAPELLHLRLITVLLCTAKLSGADEAERQVHVGRDGHRPVTASQPVEAHPEVVDRREAAPPELLGDGCGEEAARLHGLERFTGERSGAVVLVGSDRDLDRVLAPRGRRTGRLSR